MDPNPYKMLCLSVKKANKHGRKMYGIWINSQQMNSNLNNFGVVTEESQSSYYAIFPISNLGTMGSDPPMAQGDMSVIEWEGNVRN